MAATTLKAAPGGFADLRVSRVVLFGLVCLAAAVISALRVWLAWTTPLGFDEAWTLSIATTPDWRSLVAEAYNDVNAPLYYVMMRLWTGLAGTSDFALRLPGLVAVLAAGVLPLAVRIKALSFEARLTWGALVFGWWGVGVFLDARCYGLLLALSMLQAIAFGRLLLAPSRAAAWLWCGLAAAAVLVQYFALVGVLAQGLVYLAARRRAALRTWPALAAFLPALGWMAFHAPQLKAFSAPAVAWHPLIDPASALAFTAFVFNPSSLLVLPLVALGLAMGLALGRSGPAAAGEGRTNPVGALWLVAFAAVAGLALTLAFGAWKPILTGRYLVPLAPGVLLGLVLCAGRLKPARLGHGLLIALYLGGALLPAGRLEALRQSAGYGYQQASEILMKRGVDQVVFVWDHEAASVTASGSLQRAAAVFFRRAGDPVTVTPLVVRRDQDANPLALAAATGRRPGIIWIYNRNGATSASRFPPRIVELDPRWTCERASGDERVGSLACHRAL